MFCDHTNSKYTHDLFLVAPLYHRKLARLDRIIFLDVDITVQSNIAKLWTQFGTMEAELKRRLFEGSQRFHNHGDDPY